MSEENSSLFSKILVLFWGITDSQQCINSPGGSVIKDVPASAVAAEDVGWIPGSGRSPGGGHGNPFQYSCLENPMDRGTWQAKVHRAAKNQT